MASPCAGTGLVAGKFCPQCKGNPFTQAECSEARRRNIGLEVSKVWESAAFFTSAAALTIRHPLGRIPAVIRLCWTREPYYKAAKMGDPEYAARWVFTETARDVGEVSIKVEHAAGAEPGEFRVHLIA